MRRVFLICVLVFLSGCSTRDYYTEVGDHCHQIDTIGYHSLKCKKGERTGNINLNLNKPQHDSSVKP